MWWLSSILVLPLLALTVDSDSHATSLSARQAEQTALAACARSCIDRLPNNCQADDVCFCTSAVRTSYESCLASQCTTTQDQLDAQQYQATTCNRPIRDNASTLYGVTWAFFAVVVIFVALRLLSRWRGLNGSGYSWDDWVVLLSFLLVIPLNVSLDQEARSGLATDLYTNNVADIRNVLMWMYVGEILYITIVMATKIAVVLLYLRIWTAESLTKAFRLACWISIGALVLTALAFDFAVIFQCSPVSHVWNRVTGGTGSCIEVAPMLYAFGTLNILYDVLVFFLPIYSLLRLNIALHKKVGVSTVFLIGLVVTIAAIIRVQYVARANGTMNITWEYQYIGLWAVIEANLSVICICAPPVVGLIQRWSSGTLSGLDGGYANGSVSAQRVFGRHHDNDSDVDAPGLTATEMTQQEGPTDLESVLRKRQSDGQSGTSKLGDLDMKSIGSDSTSDILERHRPGNSKKMMPLFPDKNNAEATALVFRPQPGKHNKVEISHDPPSQPAEAHLAYRDENDVYHEVTITDIPHGRFPMHSKGKARPSGLDSLKEAENSDESQSPPVTRLHSSQSNGDQAKSESVRSSDPQGYGVVLPTSDSPPASRSQIPPVSQLGYQSLNSSFVGTSAMNSRRNSQFIAPTRQSMARSISLASGTLEAIDVAAKTPSPSVSQSTQSITTQTDATSVDDEPLRSATLPNKRQEVIYTPRSQTPRGLHLRSPSKSTQVDEESLSPPPRVSVDGGTQVTPETSQSPTNRWEWPSEPASRDPSPAPAMAPEPFMRAPSPLKAQSPPRLQSNLPQVAIDREASGSPAPASSSVYRDSSLQVGTPMMDPHELAGRSPSRAMSPPRGPPDQYADEPVTAHTRSVSRAPLSPPLPATMEPSSSNPPSNEVMFSPRGRSPPRPYANNHHGPRSASSDALHSPTLPTRDMGTDTELEDETDNPRTPSVPRGAEDWHLSRTVSQLDVPVDAANEEARMMSKSPSYNNERSMSRGMLSPTAYGGYSQSGSRLRSPSPQMAIDNGDHPEPSADMGVQAGFSYTRGRTPPTMSMPLPAVDIDQSHSPRTASSQAVPMMASIRSPSRSPSPTAMMAGVQSPPQEFTDDIRPPLSKAGSDQYVPRLPSPTAMMSGVVPDDYYESRRGSMLSPVRSPSPIRSPSPSRSAAPLFSPRDIGSPRYGSADAGTSPMSNGSDDEIMGMGIMSPPDIDNTGTHSADAGTSPMSDYQEEDSEPDVMAAGALPVRDVEQQRSGSADRGTSPMSDWNEDESPIASPAAPSPDVMAPRSLSADRGTSPMVTDSPRSPLPGLASRSVSGTTTGSHADPLPVRDINQTRSSSADRGTSPMSDWADNEDEPSPQYDAGKRVSGDLVKRPVLSPIQPMQRQFRPSQPPSDENTPAHTQLPFANAAGRREIPQPPQRRPSQMALPMGASGIEGTWTPEDHHSPDPERADETDDGANSPYNMPSVIHSAIIPEDRGRMMPMNYGYNMSPQYGNSRTPSEERSDMDFDERFEQRYGERERFHERANSNDFYPAGMPMFPDEFDTNERDFSPVRGIYDEDEELEEEDWPPRRDYDIPHIPSPLLAQLAGAADPDLFESRSPSRSPSPSRSRSLSESRSPYRSRSRSLSESRSPYRSRSRTPSRSPSPSPDGDDLVRVAAEAADQGRRDHTRSPSPTRRELTRMGEVAAADVFENNLSPTPPVPSAGAGQAERSVSYQWDNSQLPSPAGNATGMRSPDVTNPDPIHPELLRQELNRRASVIMADEGTDMPDTDPPRPYSAQIGGMDMQSPPEPSSARLQQALDNASPDVGAQDFPSHTQTPDLYGAQLAFMHPSASRSVSRSASRTAEVPLARASSASVQERQWQSMSPQYNNTPDNETGLPNWAATNWDERPESPPLLVVSPGLDDNNDSTPTTPGSDRDNSPSRSPMRSASISPVQSPDQGVRLSRTDSWDNGRVQESHTPGSDFMPTRPISQLDVPTLADMRSQSPDLAGTDRLTEPSSAVSVQRRESEQPSSAVAVSSPDMQRHSVEQLTDNESGLHLRMVATESTPGENQAALKSLWMRAESRQSARVPMSRGTSRAPSFEEQPEEGIPSNREANTESWYNPTVMPRMRSPSPAEERSEPDAQSPTSPGATSPPAEAADVDPYVDSFVHNEEGPRSPSLDSARSMSPEAEPSFELMQSQSEAPTADPVGDSFVSQAETEDESATSPAAEKSAMVEMATSPMVEKPAMVEMATSPMVENPKMSTSVASPSSEAPTASGEDVASQMEEQPATAEMATSPMVENPRMSFASSQKSAQQGEAQAQSSSDPIAEALLSQVAAGEQHEDEDTAGFVSASVNVPPSQLAKKISSDAEYDPFKYGSDGESVKKVEVKQVDKATLGSLVGLPKPTPIITSPSESGSQTVAQSPTPDTPASESPTRNVSQKSLPTISTVTGITAISAVNANKNQESGPPTPRVANVEVLSPVAPSDGAVRSDSHASRHGSSLSDTSGPSFGSLDSDGSLRAHDHEFDEATGPSTPPDEEPSSPFSAGLKDLFASESPQVAGEPNTTSDSEKLRRPSPPTRTVSQLAYPDED